MLWCSSGWGGDQCVDTVIDTDIVAVGTDAQVTVSWSDKVLINDVIVGALQYCKGNYILKLARRVWNKIPQLIPHTKIYLHAYYPSLPLIPLLGFRLCHQKALDSISNQTNTM